MSDQGLDLCVAWQHCYAARDEENVAGVRLGGKIKKKKEKNRKNKEERKKGKIKEKKGKEGVRKHY